MKIILNKCFGGFDVSNEAYKLYAKKKNLNLYLYSSEYIDHQFIYKKVNDTNNYLFKSFFIKDIGNNVSISNEDYKKYCLYLDSEYRQDTTLIEVIEELGEKASGRFGDLEVVEIPDNYYYKIDEYDGLETIYYSKSKIEIK